MLFGHCISMTDFPTMDMSLGPSYTYAVPHAFALARPDHLHMCLNGAVSMSVSHNVTISRDLD